MTTMDQGQHPSKEQIWQAKKILEKKIEWPPRKEQLRKSGTPILWSIIYTTIEKSQKSGSKPVTIFVPYEMFGDVWRYLWCHTWVGAGVGLGTAVI